jgi:hypothetical protein
MYREFFIFFLPKLTWKKKELLLSLLRLFRLLGYLSIAKQVYISPYRLVMTKGQEK